VSREDGTLVRGAKDLNSGDAVTLTFSDDQKKAVIDPPPATEAPKRKTAKPAPDTGDLF
jgi:exodeoxyribonuclease VII large subunit